MEYTLYWMYISVRFFHTFILSFFLILFFLFFFFFLAACCTNPSIRVSACYPKHPKQTVVVIEIFCVQHRSFKSVIVWFLVRDVRESLFQRSKSSKLCNKRFINFFFCLNRKKKNVFVNLCSSTIAFIFW